MVESMTGYGRSALKLKRRSLVVEVKSVNSKFLEVKNHLPKEFSDVDSKVTALIKKNFSRGVIDMFLSESARGGEKPDSMIDYGKAKAFYNEARKLQKSLKLAGDGAAAGLPAASYQKCRLSLPLVMWLMFEPAQ